MFSPVPSFCNIVRALCNVDARCPPNTCHHQRDNRSIQPSIPHTSCLGTCGLPPLLSIISRSRIPINFTVARLAVLCASAPTFDAKKSVTWSRGRWTEPSMRPFLRNVINHLFSALFATSYELSRLLPLWSPPIRSPHPQLTIVHSRDTQLHSYVIHLYP